MKFKNMVKIGLLGLGMGVAASAYAASCGECVRDYNRCEMFGGSNCGVNFMACVQTVPGSHCWLP